MEKITNCPICSTNSFSNYLNVEDYTVSHQEFKIQQCNACHFLFTNPRPAEEEIGAFYQSENYISHHDEAKDLMSRAYNLVRDYTLHQKLKLINGLVPSKGNLLDMGCGTGSFLQICKQNGWTINGTEPDPQARKQAQQKTQSEIVTHIDELQGDYDIVTMWHVLEHVHRLNETIDWLRNRVTAKGKIIIAVPNPGSYDAQHYHRFWAAYDVPRHLYHFTPSTMDKLLQKHQLKIERIDPMWFDSYYVSMLSSKYQQGSTGLAESLKVGSLSNWKGRKGPTQAYNTSSLIYIVSPQ
ncbi:methyltransferase family protein [Dyadobacter jejuensis]|uniref:Methyltransferase family protein n=1 Tax=Dyadobacter jejuensis TaxID=1082580 RepID=A0A316AE45_9BACT|nr:class I SAM-dependent methyltransferase [Dyadobacter jejuensis]PWJ55240.1 methyltransferase family protein [Dyadobacter jejuensis]